MTAPTPPDYSAWKHRARIRITNPSATAGYQHFLALTWKPGMRSDFRDIRVTQQSGKNCPYFIEAYTDRTSATIWIKVPDANQTLLRLHYGNGQAASASSGTDTFDFFDDFLGTSLNGTKWTNTGSISVSGGICTVAATSASEVSITSTSTFGADRAIVSRVKSAHYNSTSYFEMFGFRDGAALENLVTANPASSTPAANTKYRTRASSSDAYASMVGWSANTYFIFEIKRNGSTSVIYDVNHANPVTITTKVPSTSLPFNVYTSANGASVSIDWIGIRKYLATAPSLTVSEHTTVSRINKFAIITLGEGDVYAFDPVNIDHEMISGVGVQGVEMAAAAVAHGITPEAGPVEYDLATYNIYHPIYPTASWASILDPVLDLPNNLISVNVHQSMDDMMAQADFEYDGDAIGNYFSGDYMTKIHVSIPDYAGTSNVVFVGIAPSSKARYSVAKDKMTLTAFDYGLFLTRQILETKDLSLLPPSDQTAEGANVAKVLSYDGRVKMLQIGMQITGSVSRATGTIVELVGGSVQRMTLYPAKGKFIDNEPLTVGGVVYAYADGRSVDVPYTAYYREIMPEDWFKSILGGDNWMRTTGIEPYRLISSSGYWDTETCPAVPFMFGSKEKKMDAAKRLAKYMSCMVHSKPRYLGTGSYVQSGYFIKDSDIDTPGYGLDLPAAVLIDQDDLVGDFELDQNGENRADVVKVCCMDLYGNWLTEIRSNSYYDAGEGPYCMWYDEPQDIATKADLAEYATDMFNLYSTRGATWHGTLIARSDLQLYQLLNISGFGAKIPTGEYRIINISHEYGCAKNLTHISIMSKTAFSILRKYGMTYKDSINEVERIIQHLDNQKPSVELATVTATDGYTVTYTTEAGNTGRGRDGTSTPTTEGAIPVGAKVQVQTARGGVVCIPILASSGSSTDLLIVDVPTIVSALADPNDHNYWLLTWVPGANNTNVSVNYQITSYPTNHGVVDDHGNPASCYTGNHPKSTTHIRIRFSGPRATYYVRLWGERNGVYSSTYAQAIITSGDDVTVGDVEEPEPFSVLDHLLANGFYGYPDTIHTYEVFNGSLPFSYDGISNIYVGGPVDDEHRIYDGGQQILLDYGDNLGWLDQPVPRYIWANDYIIISGPKGSITYNPAQWGAPVNIKSLLNPGSNSIGIVLKNPDSSGYGISDIWIRSYYL